MLYFLFVQESDDFSNFQLNHLLKRGKLTQRLGTIRKEMNEKRAGELVTADVVDSEMNVNAIVQSQKIVSEETGHYILIKRTTARKPDGIFVQFLLRYAMQLVTDSLLSVYGILRCFSSLGWISVYVTINTARCNQLSPTFAF